MQNRECGTHYPGLDDGTFRLSEIGLGTSFKPHLQLRQVLQNVQHMLAEPDLELEELNIEAKAAYADAAQFAEKVKEWIFTPPPPHPPTQPPSSHHPPATTGRLSMH